MFMPLIFIVFGGLVSHLAGSESLYYQCYDENKNLKVEMCSHSSIQDLSKDIEELKQGIK